jgi:hypothetical protein
MPSPRPVHPHSTLADSVTLPPLSPDSEVDDDLNPSQATAPASSQFRFPQRERDSSLSDDELDNDADGDPATSLPAYSTSSPTMPSPAVSDNSDVFVDSREVLDGRAEEQDLSEVGDMLGFGNTAWSRGGAGVATSPAVGVTREAGLGLAPPSPPESEDEFLLNRGRGGA